MSAIFIINFFMPLRRQLTDSFKEKYTQPDFWLNSLLFVLLGIALWPLTTWFAGTAHEQSRLLHALMVLGLASVALVRIGGIEIRDPLSMSPATKRALVVAYGLLFLNYAVQLFFKHPYLSLLVIPAYCSGLAAVVRFIFGEGTRRLTRTVASTLCAFMLLSIWMEPLDWPLRSIAGKWTAYALELIGKSVELGLYRPTDGPPQLMMIVNEHPFHVASECNGFGVILTSFLLALLLAVYRRLGTLDLLMNVLAGIFLGFAFNILRIFIIVLLAPSLMDHYMLMHEIVGGVTYWACLLLVWIFLNGPTKEESDSPQIA